MTSKNQPEGMEGRQPAVAPLANPYVPFQIENPPKYEARKGLVRGTLFPGLDLPFKGIINQNLLPVTPMSELQTLSFAIQELALYLDTHPDDAEALELYRSYQKIYSKCSRQWLEHHGPLNHLTETNSDSFEWINDPWPWEYRGNKEA